MSVIKEALRAFNILSQNEVIIETILHEKACLVSK